MSNIRKIKNLLYSAGIEEREFQEIRDEICEENRHSLIIYTAVASVLLIVMFFLSFFDEVASSSRYLYAVSAAIIGMILVLARKGNCRRSQVTIMLYAFLGVLFSFGIILGTVTRPDEIASSFVVLMVLAPLLFTDRPIRMCLLILLSVVVFCVLAITLKPKAVWDVDVINTLVYCVFSLISCVYLMRIKVKRYSLEAKIRYMAQTDQLTGLKNRNCYESDLRKFASMELESISCVYLDVNGLHELNNTKGHEAGDEMLRFIAAETQRRFGTQTTYRIGGDEYVVFCRNWEEKTIRQEISRLCETVSKAGYHVAVGTVTGSREIGDMDTLIRMAEQDMYREKREYYEKNHIDRRRR